MAHKNELPSFDISKYLVQLYVYATAFNYPWELAQASFFNGMSNGGVAWVHCLGSALGDGVITLMVYLVGGALYRSWSWSYRMSMQKYMTVAVIGFVVGATIEWIALNVLHRWSYAWNMPVVPLLHLGIFPLLQMVFLLPIIFFLASRYRI